MGYGFRVEIAGPYALFSRPELSVERVSYDCITPSAARGILEAVFWKPGLRYVIDEITVVNDIHFTNIRRNEVDQKLSARNAQAAMNGSSEPLYLHAGAHIAQRASTLLKDVRYIVEAHFIMTDKAGPEDTPEKYYNMILRRLRKGQNFHQPYLGCREFPAAVRLVEGDESIPSQLKGLRELGLMLYDMDFTDETSITPTYFRATLRDGVMNLRDCEVLK